MFAILKGLLGLSLLALAASATSRQMALPNAVNEDEEPIYGWSVVGNSLNTVTWSFDDSNNLVYSYAAEGDVSNQRMYNYALRNLPIEEKDTYTVSCKFTPDDDMDLNGERTYGIVCFYQDQDNYLIYWLQQKPNEWSGQFYGRLNGLFRTFAVDGQIAPGSDLQNTQWYGGEYYDFWWDQAICNHSALVGRRDALVNTPVTLGVDSEWVGDMTRADSTRQVRKYQMWQEVDGTRFTGPKMYIVFDYDSPRPSNAVHVSGPFYTGVYSEAFSFGIDFHLQTTNTNFAANVVDEFRGIPANINSVEAVQKVESARVSYENLLEFKANVTAEDLALLTNAEARAAAYVDEVIRALDPQSATFADDVDAAVELYSERNAWIQDLVSEYNLLVQRVREKSNPQGSSSSEEPVPPESSSTEEPLPPESSSTEEPLPPESSTAEPQPSDSGTEVPPESTPAPSTTSEDTPSVPASSNEPVSSSSKEETSSGGCGSAVAATSAILSALAFGGVALLSFKKKHK
ncbi:MAG: hypothetical protein J5736_04070 [Bacilli bacterium]|nr:hypothetical protein [Bacilli bacterium]